MTTFLVNAGGLALMAAIIWWFWLPGATSDNNSPADSHH